ncbi:MAG TPA: beta-phosphoglucomutase [Eubacteriaceae bacterium]|nr:beta-phosphoglucomutase [Eubacteriaceae bacterium]
MKYEAVIFDLDGVLCHTDHYHYKAWHKIAMDLELHFDEDLNNRLRGVGRTESLEIILEANGKEMSPEEKNYYTNEKNNHYQAMLESMTPDDIDPDVIKTLTAISNLSIKTAIGSSSKNAKLIMEKAALNRYFDAISDGTNITKPKPDPEVFLKASEFLGVKPDNCLVVEDAKAGLLAGKNANMDSAAIGSAVHFGLATYNLEKLSDLLQYLE